MKVKAKQKPSAPKRQPQKPVKPAVAAKPAPAAAKKPVPVKKKAAPTPPAKPALTATKQAPAPAQPPKKQKGLPLRFALLVLFAAGIVALWKLNRTPEEPFFTHTVATTEEPAAPVPEAESLPPSLPAPSFAELEQLKAEITAREEQIKTLEQNLIAKDEAVKQELARRETGFLKHYASLIRSRVELGKGFTPELQQADALKATASPEARAVLEALKLYEDGVSSREVLKKDLSTVGADIVASWKAKKAGGGISARLTRFFQQLVSVRKVGLVEGNTPEDIVARAEYYAADGKLGKATQEISRLPLPYSDMAQNWMERSEDQRAALQLAIRLEQLLKDESAAPAQPAGPAADLSTPEFHIPPEAETFITLPPPPAEKKP